MANHLLTIKTTRKTFKSMEYKEVFIDEAGQILQKVTGLSAIEVVNGYLVHMYPETEYDVVLDYTRINSSEN